MELNERKIINKVLSISITIVLAIICVAYLLKVIKGERTMNQ